ncbi:MAG TPA: hypothetical protein VLN73_01155, partial [Alphaproteobacteria bacterium]|nr:hypothetical protein [Alphaproteobacteria bacterium]
MDQGVTRFRICLVGGTLASAAWLGAVASYLTREVGWDNLFYMLPHELGAFFAGVFAPLAFLWLALIYVGARA